MTIVTRTAVIRWHTSTKAKQTPLITIKQMPRITYPVLRVWLSLHVIVTVLMGVIWNVIN